jgi:hypothetical protein
MIFFVTAICSDISYKFAERHITLIIPKSEYNTTSLRIYSVIKPFWRLFSWDRPMLREVGYEVLASLR